jgi:alkanesulfonate monooxygenase SsuD/methylene tetrahydromethanopterin reductase-like flavin-dependent oxidoreductase (luciferase family)
VQKPHPPLWVGASGEKRMLPLVGRHADAWHAFGAPDQLKRKWEVVAKAAENSGRDPSKILRSTNLSISEPWSEVESTARAVIDAGFEYLIVSWPADGQSRVEEFLEKVASNLD